MRLLNGLLSDGCRFGVSGVFRCDSWERGIDAIWWSGAWRWGEGFG